MTGPEILKAMDKGSTLHGGLFGFWLMDVFNSRCTNVHNGAAKSLVRRKLVRKVGDTQYVKIANQTNTNDLVLTHEKGKADE